MNGDQPARPVPQRSAFFSSLRSGIAVVGILTIGSGVCCGVFTWIAFVNAAEWHRATEIAREKARQLSTEPPDQQAAQNMHGWQELARENELTALRRTVEATTLLSISLGLFLGGTSISLFSWGLRSRRRRKKESPGAEPVPVPEKIKV